MERDAIASFSVSLLFYVPMKLFCRGERDQNRSVHGIYRTLYGDATNPSTSLLPAGLAVIV